MCSLRGIFDLQNLCFLHPCCVFENFDWVKIVKILPLVGVENFSEIFTSAKKY